MSITTKPTDLLVLIDVQKDFMPGGELAVPEGALIIPEIEKLSKEFDNIVLTQDWHPPCHSSFASSHAGKAPFDQINMPYGSQILWPVHCVQGDVGADFALPYWIECKAQAVIRKGYRPDIDSYSAFLENDQKTPTGLAGFMRERGFERAVFAGLALDYCVGFSALDARKLGFEATVVKAGTRGIAPESIKERTAEMIAAGVQII